MVLVSCAALSKPASGREVGMAAPFSSPEKGSSGQMRSCSWVGILGFLREESSEHSFMAWSSPGNTAVREPLVTSDFFSTEQQLQQLSMALDSGSFLGMLLKAQRVSDVLRCNVPNDSHGNHSISWFWKSVPWSKELALKGGTNPPPSRSVDHYYRAVLLYPNWTVFPSVHRILTKQGLPVQTNGNGRSRGFSQKPKLVLANVFLI